MIGVLRREVAVGGEQQTCVGGIHCPRYALQHPLCQLFQAEDGFRSTISSHGRTNIMPAAVAMAEGVVQPLEK